MVRLIGKDHLDDDSPGRLVRRVIHWFIEQLATEAEFTAPKTRALLRIGLANYFAGALIPPYRAFLAAAEAERYDIELLGRRFDVGFETTCHRLSTLQRPEARGVSFFLIRVDRAGNISKRQSATDFHFSRIGDSCPLWNVYAAFSRPGEILTQVAQMPDGRSYLWTARTVRRDRGGYGAPAKTFAVALGYDLAHAERLVYAKGLNLRNPDGRSARAARSASAPPVRSAPFPWSAARYHRPRQRPLRALFHRLTRVPGASAGAALPRKAASRGPSSFDFRGGQSSYAACLRPRAPRRGRPCREPRDHGRRQGRSDPGDALTLA